MKCMFFAILLIYSLSNVTAQADFDSKKMNNRIDGLEKKIGAIKRSSESTRQDLNYLKTRYRQSMDSLFMEIEENESMLISCSDSLKNINVAIKQQGSAAIARINKLEGRLYQFKQYAMIIAIALLILFVGILLWIRQIIKKQSLIINRHIMSLGDQSLSSIEELQGQLKSNAGDIKDTIKKREKKTRKYIRKKK